MDVHSAVLQGQANVQNNGSTAGCDPTLGQKSSHNRALAQSLLCTGAWYAYTLASCSSATRPASLPPLYPSHSCFPLKASPVCLCYHVEQQLRLEHVDPELIVRAVKGCLVVRDGKGVKERDAMGLTQPPHQGVVLGHLRARVQISHLSLSLQRAKLPWGAGLSAYANEGRKCVCTCRLHVTF